MDKILIIDDADTLLATLEAYLEDCGYEIYTAKSGKDGLQLYRDKKPDVVLTDLHMPGISGLEVLQEIHSEDPDIPVMVISGAGEMQDAIQALRLGAWDFITKPIVDLQVLEHTVINALETKHLAEENKAYAEKNAYNLQMLKEDQVAGRHLQFSLLPAEHFADKDFHIDYKIIPSLELSGDFVEYFKITKHQYGVYLADVSGHGAASAFITILLKSIINQYLTRYQVNRDKTILSPSQIMQAINAELYAAQSHKYITINYGILNINTGTFTYGVGGHYPSPILLKSTGEAEYLPGEGFPIGISAKVYYQEQKVTIEPGDTIVMLSDGVLEVYMPEKDLSTKEIELLNFVQQKKGVITHMTPELALDMHDNTATVPDDITVLTIKRTK